MFKVVFALVTIAVCLAFGPVRFDARSQIKDDVERPKVKMSSEPVAAAGTDSDRGTDGQEIETKNKMFRNTFHIPQRWADDESFQKLFKNSYLAVGGMDAFHFVVGTLRGKGYLGKNDRMMHDYIHFMILDLLAFEGTSFITEDDIRGEEDLVKLFSDLTPDLIVKSSSDRRTTIIDIYTSYDEMDKKKSKYRSMGVAFDFIMVTDFGISSELKGILSESSIQYLASNLNVFKVEYRYWKACAELQRVLQYEVVDSLPLMALDCHDAVYEQNVKFRQAFLRKAQMILYDEGL
jgi:hypothetical protein